MHKCFRCEKDCGMREQPALYVFNGQDYCVDCMKKVAPYWKIALDRECKRPKD